MYQQPTYPIVQFLLRHGNTFAVAVALLPVLGAAVAAFLGCPWWVVPAAALAGALIWLLLKSYVEVLAIIADTLLPK